MSYPHFIVIGAMKCGTSTLATQLGAQQGVFMTNPKEPNYFSDDMVWARGPDWYAKLFAQAAPDDLRGEASTHYTKRPDYPSTLSRMQHVVPDVRLIYMIRNPLTRLVSHYIHAWSEGDISDPLSKALSGHTRLVEYGCYGWQIAPFIEAFGSKAVLLTSLEQLRAEPDSELARIAAHIGHTGPVFWRDDLEIQNVSAQRMRKLPMHKLLVDNLAARVVRRTLVPKPLRARIRAGRQMSQRPQIPDAALPELKARFAEDRSALAAYFPRDIALKLAYPFLT